MRNIFTRLWFVVLLLTVATTLNAQDAITAGKVYNIVNVANSGQSMTAIGIEKTALSTTDESDYDQLWYVGSGELEGSYTLRNLGNGRYLQSAGTSEPWEFVIESVDLYCVQAGDYYTFSGSNDSNADNYNKMHYSASQGCVVGWTTSASATQWVFNSVDISYDALQTNWAELNVLNAASENEEKYSPYLQNIFSDLSCSTLQTGYATMADSELENDENYKNLPLALQTMVKKVRDNNWAEENCIDSKPSWSSAHAMRFRLQLYEPYSYGGNTASMLNIYYHSDMNNPTGIVANSRDMLYIMVEGTIEEGANLYIQSLVGTGVIGGVDGVELHEGLNIVPCWADGSQMFIQYVVDTYNTSTGKTGYKLSDYTPLKIHIEGGDINGCFDTVGDELNPADTDTDWDAYEERAHMYNFTVLGKYMMWHMPLSLDGDYKDLAECLGTNETSVKTAMDVWEAIDAAQRLASGFLSEEEIATIPYASKVFEYNGKDDYYPSDYSEEYNNRSLAYTTADGYFMFASPGGYSHYASNTLYDVVKNIPTGGDAWGPAHEIGHTHQGPINLPSTSETSNNALANISNYFISRTSSRLGAMSNVLEQFNNETSFLGTDMNSNNVWEKLMVYTKLWFYYHVVGNNKKFYPRLFEMLRQDPISRQQGVPLTGEQTMLKFYKKACMAAEEDLTDYFDAFGFFVPVDGTYSDDYGNFKTVMTQEEIDAAKREVAEMAQEKGWKKNISILFIDDRIGTVIGADGTTELAMRSDGGNETGVLGSINDYDSDPSNDICPSATGTYGYSVSGNTITMSGATGGVGFAIYDNAGNLVSFSNSYSFPLSEEAQAAVASGTATVVVVNSDNTVAEIKDNNPSQTQSALLALLLPVVSDLLTYEDATETKVGWYKSTALTELKEAYTYANTIYTNKDLESYSSAYSVLYNEYNKVISNATSKVWFRDDCTYYIKNVGGSVYMTLDGSNVIANNTEPSQETQASLWQVTEGFYDTFYSIKNQSSNTYIQNPTDGTNSVQYTVASNFHEFIIEEVSTGKFTIMDKGNKKYLNYHSGNGTVATWGSAGEYSQWEFVYLAANNTMALNIQLKNLMELTQKLVDEVSDASVEYSPLSLQVTDADTEYYLWCNNPDTEEGEIKYLVDDNTDGSTGFFHSNWHNSASDAGYHYLEVDLGKDNAYKLFRISYSTRNAGSNHPDDITVKASNTKDNYSNTESLYTVTSGLPQEINKEWESSLFGSETAYRYLHFKIGAENTFWHMDEFDIFVPGVSVTLLDNYSTMDVSLVKTAKECLLADTAILVTPNVSEEKLETAISKLQEAYNNLLEEKNNIYNTVVEAEKATAVEELNELVEKATALYGACVSSLTETSATETSVELQTDDENAPYYLYCNAPYLADETSSDYSPASKGYNLLDGDPNTYLHTAWDGSGSSSADGGPHYLSVDLGAENSTKYLKLSYVTRNNDGTSEKPKIINIEGSNDDKSYEPISSLSGLPNVSNYTYTSLVVGNSTAYRYLRFVVADTHRSLYDENGYKVFSMAEFDLWLATIQNIEVTLNTNESGAATETEVLNVYRAVSSANSVINFSNATLEQIKAAYDLLKKEYDILDAAIHDIDALKENLLELINTTQALHDEMATDDGTVNDYYSTSTLTDENLSETSTEITEATEVYNNSSATVENINTAYAELNAKYTVLKGIKDLDVATRDELNELITTMSELLAETTEAVTETGSVALQCTDATAPFYIWCNDPASDSQGVAGLLDNNDDGTANTGTFLGTNWDSTVPAYTHYLEIDLGVNNVLEDFAIDYTTRNSTHSNQRPDGLKFSGSNDKETYEEFYAVTDGLPTDANTKWEMTVPYELAKNYRYIRIAVSTEVGYFNMSDFNLYSHCVATVNDCYSTSNIFDCLPAVLREYCDAKEAVASYMLADDYETAKKELQAQIDALNAIIDANVSDRSSLNSLVEETESLVTDVAEITETETAIQMQCTDATAPYYLYCNADGTATNGAGDTGGVAALLDNTNTQDHLHTTYDNKAQDDDLDHYLRLDMGENEALVSFKFSYTGRVNNNNNAPKTMLIEGSNDLETFEEIATLTDLPATDETVDETVTYSTTDALGNGKAYRYIRFMVTATKNGAVNKVNNEEHPFFVLSQFAVTACKTIEVKEEYSSPNLPLTTLVTANNEAVEGDAIVETCYVSQTDYDTALAELQAAKEALSAAMLLKNIPVVITTDAANPVLYKIYINRGSNNQLTKVLAYDAASTMVAVEDYTLGKRAQGWYFMKGCDSESDEDILIFPYWISDAANTTLRLASNSIEGGNSKVKAVDGTDAAYTQNWYIKFVEGTTETGWSNLQIQGNTTLYFSNHGGVSQKMGFLNDAGDNGSEFQFVLADFSKSEAYYQLYNYYSALSGKVTNFGTAVGVYEETVANIYNTEYDEATAILESATATDDDYTTAYNELKAAKEALVINAPADGAMYRLRCNYENRYLYINDINEMMWSSTYDTTSSRAIWQFVANGDGTFKMKSLHTDSYLAAIGNRTTFNDTGVAVTIAPSRQVSGAAEFSTTNPDNGLHAHGSGGYVISHTNTAGANHYYFEEVTDVEENIKFDVTLGNNTVGVDQTTAYSSLCLGYPVKLPQGVTAYIVAEEPENNVVSLKSIGNAIPANTPVILSGELGQCTLYYTLDAVATVDAATNLLGGSNYTTYVNCRDNDEDRYKIYMLTRKNGLMAMRWAYANYKLENGTYIKLAGEDANSDKGGYVKCPANKAYLMLDTATTQSLSTEYFFGFFGGTTDIDEVNTEENPLDGTIYDLQGRKIEGVTAPGFYIVNGKKMYVDTDMLK